MGGSATMRVLRDRTAGRCLAGVVVSGFGTSAMWLTAGIWVKSLTGSNSLAALTVFALWAPVLAGPALGALADRLPRKTLLVRVNAALACLLASLVLVDSVRSVWLLFVVLVLCGTGGVLLDAAESALVARAVDAPLLAEFNGLRMTANEGMKLVAPLAGAGCTPGSAARRWRCWTRRRARWPPCSSPGCRYGNLPGPRRARPAR
ncbi:hypothetical protein LUR56_09860 [Streptomyces sp. MT29]|nr:hypothetical protein [Streptomyces sp. MT29]